MWVLTYRFLSKNKVSPVSHLENAKEVGRLSTQLVHQEAKFPGSRPSSQFYQGRRRGWRSARAHARTGSGPATNQPAQWAAVCGLTSEPPSETRRIGPAPAPNFLARGHRVVHTQQGYAERKVPTAPYPVPADGSPSGHLRSSAPSLRAPTTQMPTGRRHSCTPPSAGD